VKNTVDNKNIFSAVTFLEINVLLRIVFTLGSWFQISSCMFW